MHDRTFNLTLTLNYSLTHILNFTPPRCLIIDLNPTRDLTVTPALTFTLTLTLTVTLTLNLTPTLTLSLFPVTLCPLCFIPLGNARTKKRPHQKRKARGGADYIRGRNVESHDYGRFHRRRVRLRGVYYPIGGGVVSLTKLSRRRMRGGVLLDKRSAWW